MQITKTHLLSLGPTIMHGYTERSISSTYIYQPILIDTMVSQCYHIKQSIWQAQMNTMIKLMNKP